MEECYLDFFNKGQTIWFSGGGGAVSLTAYTRIYFETKLI